jgi:hypothetical protein
MDINIMLSNLKPHLWDMMADSVGFIAGALEECGVSVRVGTSQLNSGDLNLFFDRFYIEPSFPNQMKIGNIKYGMVCTEAISPEGIWNYGAERDVPETFAAFELAVKNADFVWCLLEESLEVCRSINPNTVVIPFGYLKSMESLRTISDKEKDIDFLMCGLPSDRRRQLTEEISASGHEVYYPEMSLPTYLRDALMERSKINLSLQKTESHNTISVTRICHSVINRVPLLLEHSGPENFYSDLCIIAEVGGVLEKAQECMSSIDLEKIADESYHKLKFELPMNKAMLEVLKSTLEYL